MNSEQDRLRTEHDRFCNDRSLRDHAIRNLRCKTVIRESHGTPVTDVHFNREDEGMSNLFATVGADQATAYDDEHMGDFVSITTHFSNTPSQHAAGGTLTCCCWMAAPNKVHPHGDAYLVAGGAAGEIAIISQTEARVVALLKGHCAGVRQVCAAPESCSRPGLLLWSLDEAGQLLLWDAPAETVLWSCSAAASCMTVHPLHGDCILAGRKPGFLQQVAIGTAASAAGGRSGLPGRMSLMQEPQLAYRPLHGPAEEEVLDTMVFAGSGDRLVAKGLRGRVFALAWPSLLLLASWHIPGSCLTSCPTPAAAPPPCCKLACSADGALVCAGNLQGDVFVHDAASGSRLAHFIVPRVEAPVLCCSLSRSGRHLLVACGNGYIFRFEYVEPDTAQERATLDGELRQPDMPDSFASHVADKQLLAGTA